jgi:hypothetical protein
MAFAFGWQSYVATDLPLDTFFQSDFTVSAWVMLQYPWSLTGPILASSDSNDFYVGQGHGNWDIDQYNNVRNLERPNLVVRCGPRPIATVLDTLLADALQWRHFALVREGMVLHLYWAGTLVATVPIDLVPTGTLRFGSLPTTQLQGPESQQQFFGMLDNITVFDRAFSATELNSVASLQTRFSGTEPGFLDGWFLNRAPPTWIGRGAGEPPPPIIAERSFSLVGNVRSLWVTYKDDDSRLIPSPYWHRPQQLPFVEGAVWRVNQGWEGATSHHGGSAFCLDFAYIPPILKPSQLSVSQPQLTRPVIVTCAEGTVVDAELSLPMDPFNNFLQLEHAPGELCTYIHLRGPGSRVLPAIGQTFKQNQEIAEMGDHLHLAMHNVRFGGVQRVVTFPVAYSDYFARVGGQAAWTYVGQGVPRLGQQVMRLSPFRTLLLRLSSRLRQFASRV